MWHFLLLLYIRPVYLKPEHQNFGQLSTGSARRSSKKKRTSSKSKSTGLTHSSSFVVSHLFFAACRTILWIVIAGCIVPSIVLFHYVLLDRFHVTRTCSQKVNNLCNGRGMQDRCRQMFIGLRLSVSLMPTSTFSSSSTWRRIFVGFGGSQISGALVLGILVLCVNSGGKYLCILHRTPIEILSAT